MSTVVRFRMGSKAARFYGDRNRLFFFFFFFFFGGGGGGGERFCAVKDHPGLKQANLSLGRLPLM